MSLQSVQVYSVNGDGVLTAIPNFIFKTDSTGSAILGGCCSDITSTNIRVYGDYTDYISPQINTDGFGQWSPFMGYKGTSSAIVGGANNCTLESEGSFIGAGQDNFISGRTVAQYVGYSMGNRIISTINHGSRSFIGGGSANTLCSSKSVIVGGHGNIVKGISFCYGPPYNLSYSTSISGEYAPSISPLYSDGPYGLCSILNGPGYNAVVGGKNNCIDAIYSIIGGGFYNRIISNQELIRPGEGYPFLQANNSGKFDFIGGGECNLIENSCHSSILGGRKNTINLSHESVLVGGFDNKICRKSSYRTIGNMLSNVLVGGNSNEMYDGSDYFIGGGSYNFLSGVRGSAILGGFENRAYSSETYGRDPDSINAILGGSNNTISGGQNIIVGGVDNMILGTCCSTILGGHENIITSCCSTVIGGSCTSAIHIGSTIIGDTLRYKTSAGPHTLTLDFKCGIVLRTECVPLTSSSNGFSGQIAIDSNYFYSHNGIKWRRTALSEW